MRSAMAPGAPSSNAWPKDPVRWANSPPNCRSASWPYRSTSSPQGAGLVTEQAAGTRRIYRLNPTAVAALRDQLDTFWNRALANYRDLVEQSEQEKP
jgi:hypothetical protein